MRHIYPYLALALAAPLALTACLERDAAEDPAVYLDRPMTATPIDATVTPDQGPQARPDQGVTQPVDQGLIQDARPPVDGGAPPEDVFVPPEDATTPPPEDVVVPPEDVFAPPEDAFAPPEDAFAPPEDQGVNPDIGQADLYAGLEGLRDDALIDALRTIVTREHRSPMAWDDSKYAIFTDLDLREAEDGSLYSECIYTLEHFPLDGVNLPNFNDFNIEHSWPKSLGASSSPAKGDIHHLFPTNSRVNSRRSSFHFGDTLCETSGSSCSWADGGGSALGDPDPSMGANVDRVFMVRQEYRGDIARAHFYFSVRYPAANSNFPNWEERVLRQWHEDDPVDDWERDRNDGIQGYQGNRNPFVDHPEYVDRISDF